ITSTLAFEGGGRVQEYVGGYEDWVRQSRAQRTAVSSAAAASSRSIETSRDDRRRRSELRRRLSYNEQRELDALPAKIEALETEHRALNERIAAPGFYKETPEAIREALARVAQLDRDVLDAYTRWDELTSRLEPSESR